MLEQLLEQIVATFAVDVNFYEFFQKNAGGSPRSKVFSLFEGTLNDVAPYL
jgi:hypothetical protein